MNIIFETFNLFYKDGELYCRTRRNDDVNWYKLNKENSNDDVEIEFKKVFPDFDTCGIATSFRGTLEEYKDYYKWKLENLPQIPEETNE